jgi:hypothetical protein
MEISAGCLVSLVFFYFFSNFFASIFIINFSSSALGENMYAKRLVLFQIKKKT